uniref:Si:dkey-203a12.9 n=1 Tax=Cyprinus carpio TaxID=7962 RepID=A0A8C1KJ07_CYPCA
MAKTSQRLFFVAQRNSSCHIIKSLPPPLFCYKPNCKYYSNICPLNYSPMCGTNEITYGNECMLYSAIKASNTNILIRKKANVK